MRSLKDRKLLAFFSLVLGLILWNTWILGFLNNGLAGYLRMSISELNVVGQPYYHFFAQMEFVSGAFLIMGAFYLLTTKPKIILILISIIIGLIGALTIYDSLYSLDCNQYHNPVCQMKDNTNQVSNSDKHHNTESTITSYVTIALSLFVAIWLFLIKADPKLQIMGIICLITVLITLEILNSSSHVFADAIVQRIWNFFVTIDFLIVACLNLKPNGINTKGVNI